MRIKNIVPDQNFYDNVATNISLPEGPEMNTQVGFSLITSSRASFCLLASVMSLLELKKEMENAQSLLV